MNINDVRESATIFPRPCKLTFTFDLESGVQVTCDVCYLCANFGLGLSVLELFPMYATDRQTDVRQYHRLMPPPMGWWHNNAPWRAGYFWRCNSDSAYSESGLYGVVSWWPPKRDFGGTPLSTEWFTHLPTKLGLPSVRWAPLIRKRPGDQRGPKRSQ